MSDSNQVIILIQLLDVGTHKSVYFIKEILNVRGVSKYHILTDFLKIEKIIIKIFSSIKRLNFCLCLPIHHLVHNQIITTEVQKHPYTRKHTYKVICYIITHDLKLRSTKILGEKQNKSKQWRAP